MTPITVNTYYFETNTTPPPTVSCFRLNNTTQNLATMIWISNTTYDSPTVNIGSILNSVVINDTIKLTGQTTDPTLWMQYRVIGPPQNMGTYTAFPIQFVARGNPTASLPGGADITLEIDQPASIVIGSSPSPPSAPGQPYIIYKSGSATVPATPISITGSPIIPPPTIGNPLGL